MSRTPFLRSVLVAGAAATALLLSGCVAGEGQAAEPEPAETGEAVSLEGQTLNIDFATYNPLSLIIKDQGWLEDAGLEVNWVQSAGSNKANEALRAGAIDVGSTAGSAALLARSNGSPIQVIDIYSQPEWAALVAPDGLADHRRRGPEGQEGRRDQGHRPLLLPAAGARGRGPRARGHHRAEPAARRRLGRTAERLGRRLGRTRPDHGRRRGAGRHALLPQRRLQQLRLPERDRELPRREARGRPGRRGRLRDRTRLGRREPRRDRRRSSPASPDSTSPSPRR